MKRILTLIVAFALSVTMANAQTSTGLVVLKSSPTHVPTDTVVNTAVKLQTGQLSVGYSLVSVQADVTVISGTAGGVIRLFGSTNGTKFVRINATDSLNVNVNALSKIFVVNPGAYTHYRISYTGAGTMSMKLNSQAAWRKE